MCKKSTKEEEEDLIPKKDFIIMSHISPPSLKLVVRTAHIGRTVQILTSTKSYLSLLISIFTFSIYLLACNGNGNDNDNDNSEKIIIIVISTPNKVAE
jgi:hypothetical protein